MTTVEQHYTQRQAAGLLGLSVSTVRRLVHAGARTRGREGIYPVRVVSATVKLLPASAINRFLRRGSG